MSIFIADVFNIYTLKCEVFILNYVAWVMDGPGQDRWLLTWFIRYIYYWNLQFLINVIINKTKFIFPQA